VIDPLLDIFHDDPSSMIRERAACSVGTVRHVQSRTANARSVRLLDDKTRSWVFQALRDISGENLPHDAAAWRAWYSNQR